LRLKTLSSSSYGTFESCQFKWYCRYVLGMPEESIPSALLGSAAHKVLEILSNLNIRKRYKESKYWNWEYLWDRSIVHYQRPTKREPNAVEMWAKIKNADVNNIKRCLGEIMIDERYSPLNPKTISAEKSFSITIDTPGFEVDVKDGEPVYLKLLGKIDRIDLLNEKTVEIIDYKTGRREPFTFSGEKKKKKEVDDLYDDIQCRMYHLAIDKLMPEIENVFVTVYYLKDGGPFTTVFNKGNIEETIDMIRKKKDLIVGIHKPKRNKGFWCERFCSVGKDNMCNKIWDTIEARGMKFTEEYAEKKYGKRK
jgi:hypothetical protein